MRKGKAQIVGAIFALLIFMALLQSSCIAADTAQNTRQLTTSEKLEDFNYTYNILRDKFPYFEVTKNLTGFEWLAHRKDFEQRVKATRNDAEFYKVMNEIFMLLQDGHTCLHNYYYPVYLEYNYFVPINFIYVEGKYVVADSLKNTPGYYGIPLGSVLKSVDGIPVDKYVKRIAEKLLLSYDFKRKKVKAKQLLIISDKIKNVVLTMDTPGKNQLKIVVKAEKIGQDDLINIMLKNYGKENIEQIKQAIAENKDVLAMGMVLRDFFVQPHQQENIHFEILSDKKVGYLKVKAMDFGSMDEDARKIHDFFLQVKDYPYLIIDIRGNDGGNEQYWQSNIVAPLLTQPMSFEAYTLLRDNKSTIPINELPCLNTSPLYIRSSFKGFYKVKREITPLEQVGFKGKIYLLVDESVFSAADIFATFAKKTGWATVVGTNTGGDGIGFNPEMATMPNSSLAFSFAVSLGLSLDGTVNQERHVKPDIYIEQSFSDKLKEIKWRENNRNAFVSPNDTVINKLLNMLK